MSDRLKKIFASLVFLLMIFTQTTDPKNIFPHPTSLTEKSIVQGIGADIKPSDEESIMLTVASKAVTPSGSGEGGCGEDQKSIINTENGRTFRETIDKMQSFSNKTLFLNYAEVVVIGEAAAKNDLLSRIEYLYSSPKMRMDLLIFIAKGDTAQNIMNINSIGSETISDKLVALIDNVEKNSYTNQTTFYDIIAKIDDPHQFVTIPAVQIIQNDTDEEKQDVQLVGYSVFKDKQLLCYLNNERSRALNILKEEFKQSPFVIKDENFGLVTIEAFNIKTDIKYIPDDKYGSFDVKVYVRSNFVEQYKSQQDKNPFTAEGVAELENSLNAEIEKQLYDLVEYSKEIDNDIAEFSAIVKREYPKIWKTLESNWDKAFKEIPVKIEVQSHVANFFTLNDQIGVGS